MTQDTTKSYGDRGATTQPEVAEEGLIEDTVPELVSQERRRPFQVKEAACAKVLRCEKQGTPGNARCW